MAVHESQHEPQHEPRRTPRPGDGAVGHDQTTWFEGYLRVCNRHTFAELSHFVAAEVVVNGRPVGLAGYLDGLRTLARGFPDYHWTLQHLVLSPDGWLAAHYRAAGTHLGTFLGIPATGVQVSTEEFAFHRVRDFMITEVWITPDRRSLLEQLRNR